MAAPVESLPPDTQAADADCDGDPAPEGAAVADRAPAKHPPFCAPPDLPDDAPATTDDPEVERAKRILKGLGFCGHYMHFHGGGRSGKAPILCMLSKRGGQMSQQELGTCFELKPGSLSEILSKLETAGLIERTRDPKDRRQLFVHLTNAGHEAAQREWRSRDTFRRRAFSSLTDREQEQLADMLERIRTTWEEIDA